MAAPIVKMLHTTQSRLSQLPAIDGQFIFVKDTKHMLLDIDGHRLDYVAINVFPTDSDRLNTLAPTEGFYFVEETSVMWRYKQGWTQVTPSNLTPFYFGGRDSFPAIGVVDKLYITDDATYRWDVVSKSYIIVSTKQVWTTLEE